ncbi:MAG: hypothetical protein AB1767_05880 [Bacillota bacterium]
MENDMVGVLKKGTTTSWAVAGLGIAVTGVGKVVGGSLGAGIMGFGLAHVLLGMLDMARPTVRN